MRPRIEPGRRGGMSGTASSVSGVAYRCRECASSAERASEERREVRRGREGGGNEVSSHSLHILYTCRIHGTPVFVTQRTSPSVHSHSHRVLPSPRTPFHAGTQARPCDAGRMSPVARRRLRAFVPVYVCA